MILDSLDHIENYKGLGRVYDALIFLAETDFSGSMTRPPSPAVSDAPKAPEATICPSTRNMARVLLLTMTAPVRMVPTKASPMPTTGMA